MDGGGLRSTLLDMDCVITGMSEMTQILTQRAPPRRVTVRACSLEQAILHACICFLVHVYTYVYVHDACPDICGTESLQPHTHEMYEAMLYTFLFLRNWYRPNEH